jgi:hypothetical protein
MTRFGGTVPGLRFAICDLRFAICDLRFAICGYHHSCAMGCHSHRWVEGHQRNARNGANCRAIPCSSQLCAIAIGRDPPDSVKQSARYTLCPRAENSDQSRPTLWIVRPGRPTHTVLIDDQIYYRSFVLTKSPSATSPPI